MFPSKKPITEANEGDQALARFFLLQSFYGDVAAEVGSFEADLVDR